MNEPPAPSGYPDAGPPPPGPAPPPTGPPPMGPPPYGYPPRAATPGIAVAGFVCSLVGLFVIPVIPSILGIVFGVTGRKEARRRGAPSALATAAVCIGAVALVSNALLAFIAIPMFVNQREKARDSSVKEGVHSIQVGIETYAVDHNDVYPDASEVSRDGEVGQAMDLWPTNPFTNLPMELGTAEGDFQYEVLSDDSDYSLKGNLSGGHEFVVR